MATAKQLAAQRKFAAAARRHGGKIPRGAKLSARGPKKSKAKKTKAPKKAKTAKKKLAHFESKGRKWSQARKDAGGAARFNAAGVRIGGGMYLSKAMRERDVGVIGPRLENGNWDNIGAKDAVPINYN